MLISNSFLLIFAVAFMGCVLATPVVTRIAHWAGAIDRPDAFRRIHKGATPRLGGLGLAFGIGSGMLLVAIGHFLEATPEVEQWWVRQWCVLFAALIVLAVGFVDDTRGMSPRVKLLGQASAVLVLYFGGIRIEGVDLLGVGIDFSHPGYQFHLAGQAFHVAPLGLFVTLFWFLGCMNIWNLIDGMDGLASGVGLLVCGTLTLVALHNRNVGVAVMASALAGSLAGFLLYNWHPACIFLGDSGSLLIGLLIGVIGVQGSMKGPSAISILFPILAMGLPISDTAMAIFRRWVRNLPLSSADRKHVHHLLIGFGLNPRQAALFLYCFTGFFCGVVLLGVALRNEFLALILGISGCLAFLLILMSRRDELANLRGDLRARLARGKQERFAAKVTWEAIQRIELCEQAEPIFSIVGATAEQLGCAVTLVEVLQEGRLRDHWRPESDPAVEDVSGASAVFRLSSGHDVWLTVAVRQGAQSTLAADIAFRFLQRLGLATVERLERLWNDLPAHVTAGAETAAAAGPNAGESVPADGDVRVEAAPPQSLSRAVWNTWHAATNWATRPAAR